MRVYCQDERCEVCGSTNVITLHDNDGPYEHCNDCGHDSRD